MEVAASKWASNRNIMGMKAKSTFIVINCQQTRFDGGGLLSAEPTGYDALIYRTVPLTYSYSDWRSFHIFS